MSEFVLADHGHSLHTYSLSIARHSTAQHNEPAKGAMENITWTFTDVRKIKESGMYVLHTLALRKIVFQFRENYILLAYYRSHKAIHRVCVCELRTRVCSMLMIQGVIWNSSRIPFNAFFLFTVHVLLSRIYYKCEDTHSWRRFNRRNKERSGAHILLHGGVVVVILFTAAKRERRTHANSANKQMSMYKMAWCRCPGFFNWHSFAFSLLFIQKKKTRIEKNETWQEGDNGN